MRDAIVPKKVIFGALVAIAAFAFIYGGPFFTVGADEEGVVLTMGRYSKTVGPGFQYKLPWPFQSVIVLPVTKVHRLEIGFRTIDPGPPAQYMNFRNDPRMREEAQMLTADENIVASDMGVQWRIKDSAAFLFNSAEPEETLRDIAEATERHVIGDYAIDSVLTTGKNEIQTEIQRRIQALVDDYNLGISVQSVLLGDLQPPEEVAQAFKDVATAKEDKARIINDSMGYRNERIPTARGEAAKMINEARGYAALRVKQAEGDASRFTAMAAEYRKAKEVTETRLYLEAMSEILPRVEKIVFDPRGQVINVNGLAGAIPAVAGVEHKGVQP